MMTMLKHGVQQGGLLLVLLLCCQNINSQIIIPATQPKIIGNPNIVHAEFATFTCASSGNPAPIVRWKLAHEDVMNVKVAPIVNFYVNTSVTFLALYEDNGKNLSCIVDQTGNSNSNPIDYVTLYISYATTPRPDVPIAKISKDQYLVSPGSQVTMNCSIQSSLDITQIYWKKLSNGNMDIYPNTNPNKYGITNDILSSPKTSVLKINNIDNSNAGNYVCHAVPSSGDPGTSNTVRVNVVTFQLLSTQYTRAVQSNVTLDCSMTGTAGMNYEIRWYKNGQVLDLSRDSRFVNGNQQIPALTIYNLQTADSGKYTCQIQSGTDSLTSPEITLNVQSSAPEVTVSAIPYIKNVGENINLACSFNQPVSSVYWTNTRTNQRYTTSPLSPNLIINSVTTAHAGSYVCSGVSTASGLTGNSVQVPLIVIDTVKTQYSETVGGSVTLSCNVNSPSTNYAISWYKDGLNINIAGNPGKYEGGLVSSPGLKIKSLTTSDAGTYYCRVTFNGQTSSNSANINLQVTQSIPPSITVPTTPYIMNSGESVRLTCNVNEAVSQVYWTKVGTGQRFTASSISSTNWFLDLNQVTASNAGSYICNAVSSVSGLTGSSSAVSVVVIDPVQTQYSEKTGDDVTLVCNVNSPTNDYSVLWYKDGQNVNVFGNPSKYEGGTQTSPSLKIKLLTTSDAGIYFCRVRFNDGTTKDSSNINLAVTQGTPPSITVPTTPYILNSGNSVRLTCIVNEAVSQVYWTKVGTGQRFTASPISSTNWYLDLNQVTASNAGSYVCNAVSSVSGLTGSSSAVSVVVIDPVQTQYSEKTGDDVTLVCNVNSPTNDYTVFWYKDGQNVNVFGNPLKYEGGTQTSPSLKIKSLTTSDAGVYFCRVRFNDGTTKDSSNINLAVSQGIPPSITVPTTPYILNSGNSVRLTCTVNEAMSQVYWTKVGIGQRFTASPISSTNWYLDLNQVTASNAGSYVCNAVSSVSGLTGSSSAVSVVVIDPVQTQYSEKTGDDVTLVCNVNSPTNDYSVLWYKDGQNVNVFGNPLKYEGGTQTSPSLKIKSLTTSDAGIYFCRVRFNDGTTKDSSNINLAVTQVNPPQVTIGRSTYIANVGDNVILGCSVNEAVSQVYWTNTLTKQNYTTSTSSPSLIINGVSLANAGSYVCNAVSATTGLTGSSSPVNLIVIDSVQTQYSEKVGGDVTLNCNINSPSTGYTVSWYKDGQNVNVFGNPLKYEGGTQTSPSLKIKSLTTSDGGVYFCRVRFNDGTTKDSSNINLAVSQGSPPQVTIGRSTYIANVGDNVILGCSVNEAVSQVYWTNTLTKQNYTTSTSSPSLIINGVNLANAGSYVCNAVSTTTGLTGSSSPVNLIVIDSGSSQQYDKAVGDRVMLTCDVNPKTQSYSVAWYRNNLFLNIASNPGKYGGGNTTHPSLEIKSLLPGDDGTYYCRVTYNVDGTSMNGANHQLSILSVAVQSTQYFANNGGSIKITCVSSTTDLIEVYWVRTLSSNGVVQRLYSYTSARYTGITKEDPSITINSINIGDAGEYVCHVRSRSGAEANSDSVNVNVIRLDSTSYTHVPGNSESIVLNVELAGPTTSTVSWFKNNLVMSVDGTKYQNGNKFVPSLTINSLTESDSGVYRFTVNNNGKLYTSPDIRVSIQQATAPQVSLPSSYIGSLGGYIILQCSVTPTEGLSSVSWTLPSGSTDLSKPLNKYVGGTRSNPPLRIYSLSATDTGVYTCRASNSAGTGSASTSLTVYKKPENVQITPTSLSVNNGDPIQLTCSGDGTPTQRYEWYKGSSQLNDFDSVYYVPSASASDGGSYTCNVSNQAGFKTDTMTVTVISTASQTYSKGEGESVTLDCSVSGLTSYTITWYKDGQEIKSRGTKYFNGNSLRPPLTINPLLSSDSGTYVCSVSGTGVSKNSSNINVFVGSKPVVSIPQSKYTGSVGSFVTIPCSVNPRNNLDDVKWFRNGMEIQVLAQPTKYQNGNKFFPDLTILQLTTGDNGFYRCSATNALGTGTSQQAELTVFSVNVPSTRYRPLEGQSVTLTCSTTLSSYSVTWYKNGEKITLPSSGYQNGIYPVSSLTIDNVDVGDTGIYVCSVSGGGFTKNGSNIEVSVQQQLIAPDAVMTFNPSSVSVRPGERIQVSANAGGSPDPVYRWTKNGVVVYTGQTLIIESASASNAGTYTVTASNSAGETNGTLTINVQTQEVTVSSNQYSALVGDSVVMGCTVTGVTNFIVTWYKDEQVLRRMSRHQNGNRNIPTLSITSIIAEDDGKYICSATNLNNGESTNSSVITLTVGVIAPSNIRIVPTSLTVVKPSAINLQCVADGTSVTYEWTKGGVKLRENGLLYIQDTDRFDDGVYKCTATNKGGSVSKSINVDVQYPPVITTTVSTVTTSIGSSVTLNCENQADPVATQYEWKYGDITQLLSSSSLSVDIIDDNSFIDYSCTAINIHGSSEQHTFSLVKEGAAVVGASVGGGLSIAEILAILLGIILLILLILLLIYCCCMRGCCAACCGKCCGKKKKDSKGRVSPGIVYATKPKATVHHIDIPRFYEVPIPNWKPKGSSTASAVSRKDVQVSAGPGYYRHDEYEINAKVHLNANLSDGGTIISMYDDRIHTPRDYHLPSLDYPVRNDGKKKKRKKKHHHRHRREAEGQEDSNLVNGAV